MIEMPEAANLARQLTEVHGGVASTSARHARNSHNKEAVRRIVDTMRTASA